VAVVPVHRAVRVATPPAPEPLRRIPVLVVVTVVIAAAGGGLAKAFR